MSKTIDYIDDWCSIEKKHTDVPQTFIESAGYWLISHLHGKYFICRQSPRKLRPNLWFILSSIPGRMRRSTVIIDALYVHRKVMKGFYESPEINLRPNIQGKEITNEDIEKFIDRSIEDTIIEEGTPEGIGDHIQDTKFNEYAIVSTEFGAVLQKMSMKEYEVGVSALFSKLYYGEGGSMYLSRRGGKKGFRRIRPGLYVTMLACMQEPENYLHPKMIRQGLMRRILLNYVDTKDMSMDTWQPYLDIGRDTLTPELDAFAETLLKRKLELTKIYDSNQPFNAFINPRSFEEINSYARDLDEAILNFPDNINIYKQSLSEHLTKLSIVRAIARGELIQLPGDPVRSVNVSPEDYRKAKTSLKDFIKNIEGVITSLARYREPVRTFEDPLTRIYRFIYSAGSDGILRKDLYRKAEMLSEQLDKYLTTLQDQGKITFKATRVGKKNTPAQVWFATEFKDKK